MKRSTHVSLGELPSDDQTLRQVKSLIAYKHGVKASQVKASWNHPMDKSHGATARWEAKS